MHSSRRNYAAYTAVEEVVDVFRWLQQNETDDDAIFDDDSVKECDKLAGSNEGETLRNTLRIYGGFFVVIMILFCYMRRRFPKIYNLRNYVQGLETDLARDPRGWISWAWQLFLITDTDMLNECGMDALCHVRVLEFGIKLSIIGMINSVWLMPLYATAPSSDVTDCIKDPVLLISISNVPAESLRFVATVAGAYVIFGFAMHSILKEFEWFTRYRHTFLSKKLARNYSIYVQCIPEEYRSNATFKSFFEQASADGVVLDAHVSVKVPNLKKKVAERSILVEKLEHAISVEEITGITPVERTAGIVSTGRSLIEIYSEKLHGLNEHIASEISRIKRQSAEIDLPGTTQEGGCIASATENSTALLTVGGSQSSSTETQSQNMENQSKMNSTNSHDFFISDQPSHTENCRDGLATTETPRYGFQIALQTVSNVAANVKNTAENVATFTNDMAGNVADAAGNVADAAISLLSSEDGEAHSAGFVTFKSLRSAQAARQMVQHPVPFAMEVLEAPHPEDVFWNNVGKSHHELQLGKLFSFALTAALCLFWTIPTSFITSLTSVQGLRGELDFVDRMLTKYPWTEPLLAQVAPMLILTASEFLKVFLQLLSGLEGPISGAVVQASLFSKLASFMIIQTFFVTAIGGSIMAELSAIVNDPKRIVDLLAKTLPSQSTFYVQILLVNTCIGLGLELLRAYPIVMASIRSCIGPRLTEKERSTTYMVIFRPLCNPSMFQHGKLLSGLVLYFMVYFVYAALAPLTTYFMFVCFVALCAGYRHQFVYIYPTFPDSGGKLWIEFMKVLPVCMIIAQITIVGMLALNKAAVASSMMFPLLIITILFRMYLYQKHFALIEHLPSKDAIAIDLKNNVESDMDYNFVKDKYVQPELREHDLLPSNLPDE